MRKKYQSWTDEQLLENLQDENAFMELYHRYYRLVYYIAYEMCQNDADAQDILQETFVNLKRYGSQIRDKKKLKAWLNQVTLSKCKDLFKKNKYHHYVNKHEQIMAELPESRNYMLPEKQMHFTSDQKRLYAYIQKLPQVQKEVLVLKYFGECTMQEIAEILQISQGTVKSRLHYAKESLKALIEEDMHHKKADALTFEQLDYLLAGLAFSHWKKDGIFSYFKRHQKKPLLQSGMIAISCMIAIAGALLVHSFGEDPNMTASENLIQSKTEDIDKARNAYYRLLDMAACQSDMEKKNESELSEMSALYQYLKQENNAYYHALQDSKWEEMFTKKRGK